METRKDWKSRPSSFLYFDYLGLESRGRLHLRLRRHRVGGGQDGQGRRASTRRRRFAAGDADHADHRSASQRCCDVGRLRGKRTLFAHHGVRYVRQIVATLTRSSLETSELLRVQRGRRAGRRRHRPHGQVSHKVRLRSGQGNGIHCLERGKRESIIRRCTFVLCSLIHY